MQLNLSRTFLAGAAMTAGLALALPATASAQVGYVVQANYNTEVGSYGGSSGAFGVGGGVNFGLPSLMSGQSIRGEATFDYYFPSCDGCGNDVSLKYYEINGNLLMDIKSVVGLYVGAGINYAHVSVDVNVAGCGALCNGFGSNSDVGLNLLGGYNFPGSKALFAQAKIELGHGSPFVISGGLRF